MKPHAYRIPILMITIQTFVDVFSCISFLEIADSLTGMACI